MFSRAVEVCEAGLALYPDSTLLKSNLAIALLELERPAEASMLFRELLERFLAQPAAREPGITEDNRTLVKTMLLNDVAYATVLASPGQEELQQACRHARQAFRMMPWMPNVQGTWGSVLVESGAVKEGIEQLLEAEKFTDIPKSRADVLAHAAAGCWRLGDEARATELLRKATTLDARAYMVRRVQAEMQKGLQGSPFPATM
jgi:predicted Zn-dependent protease